MYYVIKIKPISNQLESEEMISISKIEKLINEFEGYSQSRMVNWSSVWILKLSDGSWFL